MINFYRRYIPNCVEIIAPLTEITKGRAPNVVKWDDRQESAFKEVKRVLSNEPILKLPDLNHITNRRIEPKFGWMPVTGV